VLALLPEQVMSIVSGLVETGAEHSVAQHQSAVGEWVVRNAWSLILTGSLAFWSALLFLLVWR
jgi:hypothetical protein